MIETSLRARPDVALHLRPPQVEPAIADAQRLVDALLVELERQRRRAAQDGRARRPGPRSRRSACSGSRSRARVAPPRRAPGRRTRCAASCAAAAAVGRTLRVDHDLDDAFLVAEVDEDEPAVVTARGDPAGERDRAADVVGRERAAAKVAPRSRRERSDDARRVRPPARRVRRRLIVTSSRARRSRPCAPRCGRPASSGP